VTPRKLKNTPRFRSDTEELRCFFLLTTQLQPRFTYPRRSGHGLLALLPITPKRPRAKHETPPGKLRGTAGNGRQAYNTGSKGKFCQSVCFQSLPPPQTKTRITVTVQQHRSCVGVCAYLSTDHQQLRPPKATPPPSRFLPYTLNNTTRQPSRRNNIYVKLPQPSPPTPPTAIPSIPPSSPWHTKPTSRQKTKNDIYVNKKLRAKAKPYNIEINTPPNPPPNITGTKIIPFHNKHLHTKYTTDNTNRHTPCYLPIQTMVHALPKTIQ